MVNGLAVFQQYFKDYSNSYIIIGGTACDMIIDAAGFKARTTSDIDIILIVEALTPGFVARFWEFVKDANYEKAEKKEIDGTNKDAAKKERKYYRFKKPAVEHFPFQVELFARRPNLLDIEPGTHLTPIPVDDKDLSSLSAILMNEEYYSYTLIHCAVENGLHRANTEALICLKAKAYLELVERKEKGEKVDKKNINKHKTDVFRLIALVPGNATFEIPTSIRPGLAKIRRRSKR